MAVRVSELRSRSKSGCSGADTPVEPPTKNRKTSDPTRQRMESFLPFDDEESVDILVSIRFQLRLDARGESSRETHRRR